MTKPGPDDGSGEAEVVANVALELMDDPIDLAESEGEEIIWNEVEITIQVPRVARALSSSVAPTMPIVNHSMHPLPARLFLLTLVRNEEALTLDVEPRAVPLEKVYVRRPGFCDVLHPPKISSNTRSKVALGTLEFGVNDFEVELHSKQACEVLLLLVRVERVKRGSGRG